MGPHRDSVFYNFVMGYCQRMSWYWQPQAAQMPHMNVLDFSVFPNMSRRHIALSHECGGLFILLEDDIWTGSAEVWGKLLYSQIALGYVQAYRIANDNVRAGGENVFLGVGGNIHQHIQKDFNETVDGLVRKDKKYVHLVK